MTADVNADVQARNRRLVDLLYRKYSRALLHFLCRQHLTRDEVADIVQETYCRVQHMPDVESIVSPRAFLFRVAHNLIQNARKRRGLGIERETADTETIEVAADDPSAYRVLKGEQELDVVRRAFEELSPKCRQVFVLNRFEYMSYREIAKELDVSVSMIEKYVSQALAHLKMRLAQSGATADVRNLRK